MQLSGFSHIYRRRNDENLLKNRDLLEVMKRNGSDS